MKPPLFVLRHASSVPEACAMLAEAGDLARPLAGGQSLVPMMNLRLVRPTQLVDVSTIEALHRIDDSSPHEIRLGALVTHAMIEDRRVPDPSRGLMPFVARDIAYRAIRNRGTLGGSLAHGDGASEWLSVMRVLRSEIQIVGPGGARRREPINVFLQGVFANTLGPGELIEAIAIPRCSARTRWGFRKMVRKVGEFPDAIAVGLFDPERAYASIVLGALDGMPCALTGLAAELAGLSAPPQRAMLDDAIASELSELDAVDRILYGSLLAGVIRDVMA